MSKRNKLCLQAESQINLLPSHQATDYDFQTCPDIMKQIQQLTDDTILQHKEHHKREPPLPNHRTKNKKRGRNIIIYKTDNLQMVNEQ